MSFSYFLSVGGWEEEHDGMGVVIGFCYYDELVISNGAVSTSLNTVRRTEVPKTKLDQRVLAQIKPSEASSNILSTTEPTKAVQNRYKWHLQECAPIGVVGLAGKADSVHSLLLQSCTWYIKTVEFIVERQ